MKTQISRHNLENSLAGGMDRFEFIERVAKEVMRVLHDPECNCPVAARKQWVEMNPMERLAFVAAGLECFYWIYVARRNSESAINCPPWEGATIDQQVEIAAGFCSFIFGTEFEQENYDGLLNYESCATKWVN